MAAVEPRSCFRLPRLVRFSWQTVTTLLLENGGVPMLVPADEEDASESGGGWQRGEQTPKVMPRPTVHFFCTSISPLLGFPILCACCREHAQAAASFLQPRRVLIFVNT